MDRLSNGLLKSRGTLTDCITSGSFYDQQQAHPRGFKASRSLQMNLPSAVGTHFVKGWAAGPEMDFEAAATASVAAATKATIAKANFAFIISLTSLPDSSPNATPWSRLEGQVEK